MGRKKLNGTCLNPNCGSEKVYALGLCCPCYSYKKRTGLDRPIELTKKIKPPMQENPPNWCIICGNPELVAFQRCNACYQYLKEHGKERPVYYWYDEVKCKNCKKPLANEKGRVKGRCQLCHAYWYLHKKERPKKWWKVDPELGWCDCGKPAVAERGEFNLCKECDAIFAGKGESQDFQGRGGSVHLGNYSLSDNRPRHAEWVNRFRDKR